MKQGLLFFMMLFAVLSSSVIVFGEKKVEKERLTVPIEWCDKIGMRDTMLEMKQTTAILSDKLMYEKWDEVKNLSAKLKELYDGIELAKTNVPDDYWEFHDDFLRYYGRFAEACEQNNIEQAEFQYKRVKTACRHCHIRYVRRKSPDRAVGLERLYKDQFKEWGNMDPYTK